MLVIAHFREQGLPVDALVEGVGYTLAELQDKHERIEWSAYCRLVENAQRFWSLADFERCGARLPKAPFQRAMTLAGRLLYTPEDIYEGITEEGRGAGNQLFTCVVASIERLGPRRLRLDLRLRPGYPMCEPFFWATKGSLSFAPEVLGLAPAAIRMTLHADGATYDIALPPGGGLLRRAWHVVSWPFTGRAAARELQDAHVALLRRYEQLDEARRELEATQAQLVQAGKLAALGEIGAGIAHELNQPIQSILGFAQRVQRHSDARVDDYADELDRIIRGGRRMAHIVEAIQLFARQSPLELELIDPLEPLEAALDLIGEQLRQRCIRVTLPDAAHDLPPVRADVMQLEQVYLNLMLNARDALDDATDSRGHICVRARSAGDRVLVCVEDNGPGVPAQVEQRLFDPFYTTKDVGHGTGLGLSISYGIVRQHGGELRHERPEGGGARFVVALPMARPDEPR